MPRKDEIVMPPRYASPARDPRTIILLHRGGPIVRGTEVVLIRSAQALAAVGYRLVVCRNNDCIDQTLKAITPAPQIVDFRFPELMIDGIWKTARAIPSYIGAFRRLKALVKTCNPALLYCSGGLPCQLAVPVARPLGIPVICHFHHPATRRARHLWLALFADELIFPSAFTQRHTLSNHQERGLVIYNGVDLMRFRPPRERVHDWRAELGIPSDATVIGQVGALVGNKRPDFLITAFTALLKASQRPVHLCLVGAGPMEERLRKQANELGIQHHVTLTGYVDDVLPYYQHVFDINVLASRIEGLGISVIEGSACGLPAVVSNCTGLPETIIENRTGLLFEVNDEAGLRRQLLRLTDDAALRTSMGRAAVAYAEERFSSMSYDRNFVAAIAGLLQRAGRAA